MSHLLVDGYNLLGSVKADMEKERKNLIHKIFVYCQERAHQATVVFDGWKNGLPVETRDKIGRVTVIYSKLNETADIVIKRIIAQRQREWIVISSDREIINTALKHSCLSLPSSDFYSKLNLPDSIEDPYCLIEEDYLPYGEGKKKGNPRRLSKKERKRQRAIKKL
jgi:predicted RNA-binding protein with PIN domain